MGHRQNCAGRYSGTSEGSRGGGSGSLSRASSYDSEGARTYGMTMVTEAAHATGTEAGDKTVSPDVTVPAGTTATNPTKGNATTVKRSTRDGAEAVTTATATVVAVV